MRFRQHGVHTASRLPRYLGNRLVSGIISVLEVTSIPQTEICRIRLVTTQDCDKRLSISYD